MGTVQGMFRIVNVNSYGCDRCDYHAKELHGIDLIGMEVNRCNQSTFLKISYPNFVVDHVADSVKEAFKEPVTLSQQTVDHE